MSEKWVAVEYSEDQWGTTIDEVHGIFKSEQEAKDWAYGKYYGSFEVKRIRKAPDSEWA